MAPRPATGIEELRGIAKYVDASLQPTLNELPSLFAALVETGRLPDLADTIAGLRKEGAGDPEITQQVAHTIAPPDPDAGATIVQGIPPEQHAALQSEVAELRELVAQLHQAQTQQAQYTPGPVADPNALTPEQEELQALRQEIDQLRVAAAATEHPTAESEPVAEADQP